MLRTRRVAYLEPGELAMMPAAMRTLAHQRLRASQGRGDPQAVLLLELAGWIGTVLAVPTPPLCVLRPVTTARARRVAYRVAPPPP